MYARTQIRRCGRWAAGCREQYGRLFAVGKKRELASYMQSKNHEMEMAGALSVDTKVAQRQAALAGCAVPCQPTACHCLLSTPLLWITNGLSRGTMAPLRTAPPPSASVRLHNTRSFSSWWILKLERGEDAVRCGREAVWVNGVLGISSTLI